MLFPPADEGILGAKLGRLSRTRYRQVPWAVVEGRADSRKPCRHYATLQPILRLATRVALRSSSYPVWSRTGPRPYKRRGSNTRGASRGHRNGASQSSNVARVSPPPLIVRLHVQSISFIGICYVNSCPTSDSNALIVTMRWQKRGYDRRKTSNAISRGRE